MSSETRSKQEHKRKAPTNGDASKKSKKTSSAPQRTNTTYQVADEMIRSLVSVKASSLFPGDSSLYVCTRTDKLVDVWQGLAKHGFLSAPVLKLDSTEYTGFIEMSDIVHYIVSSFGTEKPVTNENYLLILVEDELFKKQLVADAVEHPLSSKALFKGINEDYSLFSALEMIAREPKVHRVPILDSSGKLVGLITQSMIIQFLNENLEKLGPKRGKPIMQCVRSSNVLSVKESDLAINAFKLMAEKNVNGIAVVDKDGKLVDNISTRDLKAIGVDAKLFWRLYQSASNFRNNVIHTFGAERPSNPVCLSDMDTLEDAIKILAETKVHRLFIVDENFVPISVISLKDVLLEIIGVIP